MGISRMLRHIDANKAAKLAAGEKVQKAAKKKKLRRARNAESYRGARKAEAKQSGDPMLKLRAPIIDGSYDGSIELNRSIEWSRAKDYGYAREISPSKEPVR